MNLREFKIRIPTPTGTAPSLVIEPECAQRKGAILVAHGLGAEKEVQRKEMIWLAEAGFSVVALDAPHHGERKDGYLETLSRQVDSEAHTLAMKIVQEAVTEIPAIVEYCLQRFTRDVGITGISLGGFIAYAAVVAEPRLKASVPILGSPDWSPKAGSPPSATLEFLERAPVRFPHKFAPCALFAANAGKDIFVPPAASREFVLSLQPTYQKFPERLKYIEYPESEHFMREQDWNDLWRQIIEWFDLFLE